VNILRRISLSRLLIVCALVVGLGASATAIAFALDSAPKPPPKPLADAVHDALVAPPVQGVSASVKLTNHLLEGAELANGSGEASQLSAGPLLSGASGRLWIAEDGRTRLELQAEDGDTQVFYDGGREVTVYDASSNIVYRVQLPAKDQLGGDGAGHASRESHLAPSVAKIEEAIAELDPHVKVSGAAPASVAGRPAYTTRISPGESGSLIGGAELSWDAVHGVPLRTALYSSTSDSPVIELAATDISYGRVADSVFQFTPPAGAKTEEFKLERRRQDRGGAHRAHEHGHPNVTVHGQGVTAVAVAEGKAKAGGDATKAAEGLPKVKINGTEASELPTALGTLLSFQRAGVRYLLVGSVTPAAIEAVARGL
jgi:outer membrane lipoprotein-sorting protein